MTRKYGEASALRTYPFFYNRRVKGVPQTLYDEALYRRYRASGKSWRGKVANFRHWWVKAARGVSPARVVASASELDTRWCTPAGLACGRLPQRYCRRLFCPFCYVRMYVEPTYLRLLDAKGRTPIALRVTRSVFRVPQGERWTDHVASARPRRPRGADLAYLIVPCVAIAPLRGDGRLDDDYGYLDDADDSAAAIALLASGYVSASGPDHEEDEDDDCFDIYGDDEGGPVRSDVYFDPVAGLVWYLWTREIRVVDPAEGNCTVIRTPAELASYVGYCFGWPRDWHATFNLPDSLESEALREELLSPRGYAGGRLYACSGRLRKKGSK